MIDFVVVSSDLRPSRLGHSGKERLSCQPITTWWEVFNSHLRKSFSQIPREAGDIEFEWTMFSASIVVPDSSEVVDAKVSGACRGGNPRTRWWTPELTGTGRPSKPQPRTVLEAKTRVWEEFGEAMEEDYRSASKRFWQTVRRLRRGKQYSANTVYSAGGELLTSTEFDIVGRWKKYFEDLLNPTDLPSSEEAGAGDSEVDSSITRAEVTEVVRKLLRWQGAGGTGEENSAYSRPLDSGGTMRFSSWSWNSGPALIPSTGCWRVYGSPFPNQSTCALWIWRRHSTVSLVVFCVGVLHDQDLQHVLERFAAECEAAGMRISTSKSEAMVLDRKRVACPLRVGGEVLPQVEEFKYLGVLFTSEGKMEREIDRRIGAASAVMRSVYRTVVVKKELSRKAKLSIYRSIYVPTLTYGMAGRSLRDRVRSSVTREELGVEPLLLRIGEESAEVAWASICPDAPWDASLGRCSRRVPPEEALWGRPRTRWRDYVSRLAWECLGISPEELEEVSGVREVWASLLRLLPPRPGPGPSG
ncbi:hypothetical protein L3Q82_025789 [Scortum barcoo]|uniref:Uncharacterized protein n=1 Tax=Scortum barcoo TaxID=214431 RepID=A0ACB8WM21_9TELE|nr:hypothetical protein L3Q82_025789 [Scortum barcoo]